MMTGILSLLVCLVGLVAFCISNNPKVQALAKDAYWCGLLAFLLQAGERVVSLLR